MNGSGAMTCFYHAAWTNLEGITAELTCEESRFPRAPSCQLTQRRAPVRDGKMSPLLRSAICLKNIAPSWSPFVILLTNQADKPTRF